jgi:hypothetical protein
MDRSFDFEKILRSCFETLFDVKPELRRGGDLYPQLINGLQHPLA